MWGDSGTLQGECGRSALLRATSWRQQRVRGDSVSTGPGGRGETFYLKNLTCCDWGSRGRDSSPSPPVTRPGCICLVTSLDLGQVISGCFPSGQSRSAFSLPALPAPLNHLEPLLKILIPGTPRPAEGTLQGGWLWGSGLMIITADMIQSRDKLDLPHWQCPVQERSQHSSQNGA